MDRPIVIIELVVLILLVVLLLVVPGKWERGLDNIPKETFDISEYEDNTPTPDATPAPVSEEQFILNFVGDNTLAGVNYSATTGSDPAYPYANTKIYMDEGEFNFANLECVFSDKTMYSSSLFSFKAPSADAAILTSGGIDFVSLANNHTGDFGQVGLDDTVAAVEAVGVGYGLDGKTVVYETENGLKLGIYCASHDLSEKSALAAVEELKQQEVDLILCAFHWGSEGAYHPSSRQTELARKVIDAGADIVYGAHAHVLQPVEEYNGGIIMYSLGSWSFGGNSHPADMDSAIVRIIVKRGSDKSVSMEGWTAIPCSVSSIPVYSDYKPTPYTEGTTEYDRAMSKLLGTFTGPDLVVDYSRLYASRQGGETVTPEPTQIPAPQPSPDAELPPNPDPEVAA